MLVVLEMDNEEDEKSSDQGKKLNYEKNWLVGIGGGARGAARGSWGSNVVASGVSKLSNSPRAQWWRRGRAGRCGDAEDDAASCELNECELEGERSEGCCWLLTRLE